MKRIFLIIAIAIVGAQNFVPLHAQTVTGPVREIKFTTLPKYDKNAGVKGMYGYEVEITFKYRFQLCAGVITLNGYRTANTAVAYWVAGKRYSWGDLRVFNTQNKTNLAFATNKSDLYPNLDFEADIWTYDKGNAGTTSFFAKGKWTWVNLPDWGGCLGDYGNGSSGDYKQYEPKMTSANKDRVGSLFLKDVQPKDTPNRDYDLEAALSGKKQRPLEAFKDVKQVTENLKNEARTETATRENAKKTTKSGGKKQTDDDLLNDTGYGNKQQDLDALLGSTGYGSEKEITDRQLAAADAAAQNVSSFSDRTHLLEAKKLYEKALAADLNVADVSNTHAAQQLKRIEWVIKHSNYEIFWNKGKWGIKIRNYDEIVVNPQYDMIHTNKDSILFVASIRYGNNPHYDVYNANMEKISTVNILMLYFVRFLASLEMTYDCLFCRDGVHPVSTVKRHKA